MIDDEGDAGGAEVVGPAFEESGVVLLFLFADEDGDRGAVGDASGIALFGKVLGFAVFGDGFGILVEVFNDRGTCLARARLSEDVTRGVLILPTGAWYRPDGQGRDTQGNPNVLTRDRGTSRIAQGSTAQTALVDVRPV